MTPLDEQRHFVAVQLAGLIVQTVQRDPKQVEIADAVILLDNIADYVFAVAQERLAQAICNTSAAKLSEAILKKHAETAPPTPP